MRFDETARQLCILFNYVFLLVYGGVFAVLTFVAVVGVLVFPWFVAVESMVMAPPHPTQSLKTIALIHTVAGFVLAWGFCAMTIVVTSLMVTALRIHTYPIPLSVLLSLCAPATLFFALEYIPGIAPLTHADGVLLFSYFVALCVPQTVFFALKNRTVIPTYMPEPDSHKEK